MKADWFRLRRSSRELNTPRNIGDQNRHHRLSKMVTCPKWMLIREQWRKNIIIFMKIIVAPRAKSKSRSLQSKNWFEYPHARPGEAEGASAPSGVNDQPKSLEETITGAINRATSSSLWRCRLQFLVLKVRASIKSHNENWLHGHMCSCNFMTVKYSSRTFFRFEPPEACKAKIYTRERYEHVWCHRRWPQYK